MFEGLELGTEATRTGIIDNAIQSKYIELKKDVYHILPDGEFLIESLLQMGISMDKYKTSEMGKALKSVFHGTMTVDESVDLAKKEISEVFSSPMNCEGSDTYTGLYRDVMGICPLCGGDVIRQKRSYSCANYKENGCAFTIWMNICSKTISTTVCRQLLEKGETEKLSGFISKNGKPFSAKLVLKDGKATMEF